MIVSRLRGPGAIALALLVSAAPLQAQDKGKDDPFDIFNPVALGEGAPTTAPAPTPGERVLDAGAAQGKPQARTRIDGPEMERAFAEERTEPPPAELRRTIDDRIEREVKSPADRYGAELADLNRRAATDPEAATREAVRIAGESDAGFPDLSSVPGVIAGARDEVEAVAAEMDGEGRPIAGATTGSPWDNFPSAYANHGYSDPSGVYRSSGYEPINRPAAGTPDGRLSWWQKLMLSSLEGVAEGLKGLSERRANELRAREERIRRDYPEYRAYVEVESRRAIERSAFARAGYDKRLDGLILGPAHNPTPTASTPAAAGPYSNRPADLSTAGVREATRRPVARLPRKPDPVTGEERIVIDMPLGVDPVRPIR
ncbi:MAG: hypothetical protein M9894_34560 [Planctomycetes bacterium]|nr:hypothetical protein [Planctomycetota bacterium]